MQNKQDINSGEGFDDLMNEAFLNLDPGKTKDAVILDAVAEHVLVDNSLSGKKGIERRFISNFYFKFSVSILVVMLVLAGVYMINDTKNESGQNKKQELAINAKPVLEPKSIDKGSGSISKANNRQLNSKQTGSAKNNSLLNEEDTLSNGQTVTNNEAVETRGVLTTEKASGDSTTGFTKPVEAKMNSAKSSKKIKLFIPPDPEKANSYSGTLYEGSSLCDVVSAYKFPGTVRERNISGPRNGPGFYATMKTISCSHLDNTLKVIWLKGKIDEKMMLTVKKGFENILLVKSDGKKIKPEAIGHYYRGRGVIVGFSGKLTLHFKDKVELILFFRNAEDGDKIVIDGIIEAVVKNKP
jgi:hypothetical protein